MVFQFVFNQGIRPLHLQQAELGGPRRSQPLLFQIVSMKDEMLEQDDTFSRQKLWDCGGSSKRAPHNLSPASQNLFSPATAAVPRFPPKGPVKPLLLLPGRGGRPPGRPPGGGGRLPGGPLPGPLPPGRLAKDIH